MSPATWSLILIIIIAHLNIIGALPFTFAENDTEDANSYDFLLTYGNKVTRNNVHRTHIVSLRTSHYVNYWGDNHFCAGVIISRRLVITAAHCVVDLSNVVIHPKRISVVVGTMMRLQKTANTLELTVKEIVVHYYYTRNLANDISLLILNEDIPTSLQAATHIKFSKFAPKKDDSCFTLGWGLMYPNGPYADELLYLNIKIISQPNCKKLLERYNPKYLLCGSHDTGEEDACPGDFGGPLICNNTLSGIIAGSTAMCDGVGPIRFTNIIYYLDWIDQVRDAGIRDAVASSYLLLSFIALILIFLLFDFNIVY